MAAVVCLGSVATRTTAQDPIDPSKTAVLNEFQRREENLEKLSVEDQAKIRGAQQKALEKAEVKAAVEKRDQAIVDFRAELRKAMIEADPSVKPILDKIAQGADPGIAFGR